MEAVMGERVQRIGDHLQMPLRQVQVLSSGLQILVGGPTVAQCGGVTR